MINCAISCHPDPIRLLMIGDTVAPSLLSLYSCMFQSPGVISWVPLH